MGVNFNNLRAQPTHFQNSRNCSWYLSETFHCCWMNQVTLVTHWRHQPDLIACGKQVTTSFTIEICLNKRRKSKEFVSSLYVKFLVCSPLFNDCFSFFLYLVKQCQYSIEILASKCCYLIGKITDGLVKSITSLTWKRLLSSFLSYTYWGSKWQS